MLRIIFIGLVSVSLYLGYQNHELSKELVKLKATSKISGDVTTSNPLTTDASAVTGPLPQKRFHEKLQQLKDELSKKKDLLNSILTQHEKLVLKLKSANSFDPVENDRQLQEKKAELVRLQAKNKEIKVTNASILQSPIYTDIKVKLAELEKKIHDLKTAKDDSSEGKIELGKVREELKKVQQEQKTYLESVKSENEHYSSRSSINQMIKVLKSEIAKMEKATTVNPEEESKALQSEIQKSDQEISRFKLEIQDLEKMISETGH